METQRKRSVFVFRVLWTGVCCLQAGCDQHVMWPPPGSFLLSLTKLVLLTRRKWENTAGPILTHTLALLLSSGAVLFFWLNFNLKLESEVLIRSVSRPFSLPCFPSHKRFLVN